MAWAPPAGSDSACASAVGAAETADREQSELVAEPQRHERHRLLVEWNATTRPYPTGELMHEPFESHARDIPDKVALVDADHSVTYRALNDRADRWAARLQRAGVHPDTVVGVHMSRSAELIAALLGVLKAGAAYLPLDPAHPDERLRLIAAQSRMFAVITDQPDTAWNETPLVRLSAAPPVGASNSPPRPSKARRPDPTNLAYILFTSGSTGAPKGVAITHGNAVDLLYWSAETFEAALGRVVATTSIGFDCSILEIFGPLFCGGTVVLADSAMQVITNAVGHDARLLHAVPSVMAELVRLGELPRSVSTVLLGGEALWPQLVDDVHQRSGVQRLINVYGPTEYTSYTTWATVDRATASAPPIGRPVANTRVFLLGPGGDLVAVGAAGEVYISGRGLARGYLHQPALTADRFLPHPFPQEPGERWYRTGDLARYDDSGLLHFLGRVDDQIKVRGVRVEPAEVERALLNHPQVAEAAVVAPRSGAVRHQLLAYVVLKAPASPSPDLLRDYLRAILPPALVPDRVAILDSLPRTPNGKVDRTSLASPKPDGRPVGYAPPRDHLEELLVDCWAETLGCERVGIHDDFYELGGHSLAATQIAAQATVALDADVSVSLVFASRTVASLAESIRGERPVGTVDPHRYASRPSGVEGPAPLSANQRAIWSWARRAPADPRRHLPDCVRIQGELNLPALSGAVTELVRRHHALRSTVRDSPDGELVQITQPAGVIAVPLVDLSGLPAQQRATVAEQLSAAAAQRPFDLSRTPLLHAETVRLSTDDHVLTLALHQLTGDVWSVGVVGGQLLDIYRAFTTATRSRSVPPPVQYPDIARQQTAWLASGPGQRQRRFWREQLADLPTLALWPQVDRRNVEVVTADEYVFAVPDLLMRQLAALAREETATLYMVFLCAYFLALGAWSDQSRLIVGCPVSGRVRPHLGTIGPFVNAVPIGVDLPEGATFRRLLRLVRETAWQAYAHADVPFAQLVEDLGADIDPTRHPLYQASLAVHHLPGEPDVPDGLSIAMFGRRPAPHTALDLEMNIYLDDPDTTRCSLTYRDDLSDTSAVARFAATWLSLLERMAADPDQVAAGEQPADSRHTSTAGAVIADAASC